MASLTRLYLGSSSPRRAAILANLGLKFRSLFPPEEEENSANRSGKKRAETNALAKYTALEKLLSPPFLLLTADTVVWARKKILEKPKNREQARQMLHLLSSQTHEVITALVLGDGKRFLIRSCTSKVTFHPLSREDIEGYLETEEPWDKAGGYAIQGLASRFVKKVEGSYTNVVGLPIETFLAMLESLYQESIWQVWKKIH